MPSGLIRRFHTAKALVDIFDNLEDSEHRELATRSKKHLSLCLNAYGRCLLSLNTNISNTYANEHAFHRKLLLDTVREFDVTGDAATNNVKHHVLDHLQALLETIDTVLSQVRTHDHMDVISPYDSTHGFAR